MNPTLPLPTLPTASLLGVVLHPQCVLTNGKEYPISIEDEYLTYYVLGEVGQAIEKRVSIHEISARCKDWIVDEKYTMSILSSYPLSSIILNSNKTLTEVYTKVFDTTEPEAIFEACEWILAQKEK